MLVSRANGSPELVGRAAICSDPPLHFIFPDTAIRYRLGSDAEFNHWIVSIWNCDFARAQLLRKSKSTAGILKVSQTDIRSVAIPIPGRKELSALVELLRAAESKVYDVPIILSEIGQSASYLRQSILSAAFRGQLI